MSKANDTLSRKNRNRRSNMLNRMMQCLFFIWIAFNSSIFFLSGVQAAAAADDFYGLLEINQEDEFVSF